MKRALAKEILDFGHKATQVAEKLLESDADSEGEFEESSNIYGGRLSTSDIVARATKLARTSRSRSHLSTRKFNRTYGQVTEKGGTRSHKEDTVAVCVQNLVEFVFRLFWYTEFAG